MKGCFLLAALLCAATGQLAAQAMPTTDVHIYVSLSDSSTRFYPVPGHRMILYRSARDSLVAITDASGSTTIYAVPGTYRLVSAAPVEWHGKRYSWSVPLSVTGATTLVDLNSTNATVNGIAPSGTIATAMRPAVETPLGSQSGGPAGSSAGSTGSGGAFPKDPSSAFLWSFFFPGAGQMYAGETGKGAALLVVSTVGVIGTMAALQAGVICSEPDTECSGVGEVAAVSAALWLVPWIYSMADAGNAARRYNAKHGFAPMVTTGARGTTRVGLAVRF